VAWLIGRKAQITPELDDKAKELGLAIEDVQLAEILSNPNPACGSDDQPVSEAMAIFPFVMRMKQDDGALAYRVRYKLCEYYVDQDRQLPIENACQILGRETGYTFEELTTRFQILKAHVANVQDGLKAVVYGAGVVGTVTSFRFLRLLRVGGLPALALGSLPIAGSALAVHQGWTDNLARDLVDMQDAAEVAVTGTLATSVKISRPMQDFVPYFSRYLDSMN
jgi:hypothetical protein